MAFFVSIVPVCPIRAEAAHRSEQISQLLFGEVCELLESAKDFLRVRVLYDQYEGWCQASQLVEIDDEQVKQQSTIVAGEWMNKVEVNNQPMMIPFGSSLDLLEDGKAHFGKYSISYQGSTINIGNTYFNEANIEKFSTMYLNTSYQWGGRTVFGVDCSGFCQLVFKCMGIHLMRDAYQQATQGEVVGFMQEAKCGDLAFFDNEAGKITHVGILLNSDTIIHSSGKVRIDTIDNLGIINRDTGKRTHNTRVIKRIAEYKQAN
jgi:gamma-D-glutamyl-L-lysine dipeptidyl-peptidase